MYVVRIEDLKEPLDEQNFIIAASPDPQSQEESVPMEIEDTKLTDL